MSANGHSAGPAGSRFAGAPLGGLPALTSLLRGPPGTFPVPVLVVPHRPHRGHGTLARVPQEQTCLPARAGRQACQPGIPASP